MQTRSQWSSNTYMPYLKEGETDINKLDKDSYGQRLVFGDRHIICKNDEYILRYNDSEEKIKSITIQQNDAGIDVEDRILILKQFIQETTQ